MKYLKNNNFIFILDMDNSFKLDNIEFIKKITKS